MSCLKKALQPSVTDVVLTFDVPYGVEVQQSPSKIPPVFEGERLVMYGVLKSKKKGRISGRCTATLSGNLLGGAIRHTVEFTVGNEGEIVAVSFPVPVIHHLAAKRLINDWQSEEKMKYACDPKKSSIVQLSVDSGVISTHTAFIAIDEAHGKPIEGAMKTWDLTATETRGTLVCHYERCSPTSAKQFAQTAAALAAKHHGGLQPPGSTYTPPARRPPVLFCPPLPPRNSPAQMICW